MGFWTEERIDVLRKMHDENISASIAAERLGCTRNAVIGKWHRLGLERCNIRSAVRHLTKPYGRPVQPRAEKRGIPKAIAPLPKRAPALLAPAPIIVSIASAKPIVALAHNECKWPVGENEDGHLFCAATTPDLHPYCASHARVAYQPLQARRSARPRPAEKARRFPEAAE